jgi:hypothetical protein
MVGGKFLEAGDRGFRLVRPIDRIMTFTVTPTLTPSLWGFVVGTASVDISKVNYVGFTAAISPRFRLVQMVPLTIAKAV